MEMIVVPAVVLTVISLMVGGFLVSRRLARQRTEQLQSTAESLGFKFHAVLTGPERSGFRNSELLERGRGIEMTNALLRVNDGVDVVLFDHKYTTGSGKHAHTTRQSVMAVIAPDLKLPMFTLSAENLMTRVASAFGYQDIDLPEYPEFSRTFLLRGPSEQAIRDKFTRIDLRRLVELKGFQLEGEGGRLLIWRQGHRFPPDQIRTFFEQAYEIYTLFRS